MSYTLLGKKVLNEHIVLGVYGLVGAAVYASMSGKKDDKATKAVSPEVNSSSSDEAAFIRNFMENLEREDAATAKH